MIASGRRKPGSTDAGVDCEPTARQLTGIAAEVVRKGHVELALAWLWSSRTGEPLPRLPRELSRALDYVRRHGGEQIEPGYSACRYFEDCLRLALRQAPAGSLSGQVPRTSGGDAPAG